MSLVKSICMGSGFDWCRFKFLVDKFIKIGSGSTIFGSGLTAFMVSWKVEIICYFHCLKRIFLQCFRKVINEWLTNSWCMRNSSGYKSGFMIILDDRSWFFRRRLFHRSRFEHLRFWRYERIIDTTGIERTIVFFAMSQFSWSRGVYLFYFWIRRFLITFRTLPEKKKLSISALISKTYR